MSRTALICDDAAFMRRVIEKMLVGGGFTIVDPTKNKSGKG